MVAPVQEEKKVNWELPPSPFLQTASKSELDPASIAGWGVAVYLMGTRNPVARREFETKGLAMSYAEEVIGVRGVWAEDAVLYPPHKIDRCVVVPLTAVDEANS